MKDSITLTAGTTAATCLDVRGARPGTRSSASVEVTFNDTADARVALYGRGDAAGPLAHRLRISIFERTGSLLPFPIYHGTLAEFAARASYAEGVGRWTARGDGADHTVTYEVTWTVPQDAEEDDRLALVWEARETGETRDAAGTPRAA